MYVAMNTHINATIVEHRDPPKYVTFPHSHHNTADSSHSFINAQHLDSGQAASMFLNVSYHSLAQSVSTSTAAPTMEESKTTTASSYLPLFVVADSGSRGRSSGGDDDGGAAAAAAAAASRATLLQKDSTWTFKLHSWIRSLILQLQ